MTPKECFSSLSSRQKEVLRLVCQGLEYKEIAQILVIGESTVKSHMRTIYEKLGLLDLKRDERVYQIRAVYCPFFNGTPQEDEDIEIIEVEPEPEAITPEENLMLIKDQNALLSLRNTYTPLSSPPKKKSAGRRVLGCFSFFALLIILGLALFGGYTLWQSLNQTGGGSISLPVFSAPSAYEIGEWHKEGDIWIRLVDYKASGQSIRLNFEIWNQSDRDIFFSWSTHQNFSMIDNKKNHYEVFKSNVWEESVKKGERLILDGYGHDTVSFSDDSLYESGVTDLYVTTEYLSVFDKVTFHIAVGK